LTALQLLTPSAVPSTAAMIKRLRIAFATALELSALDEAALKMNNVI
jgi:hypothetical protein